MRAGRKLRPDTKANRSKKEDMLDSAREDAKGVNYESLLENSTTTKKDRSRAARKAISLGGNKDEFRSRAAAVDQTLKDYDSGVLPKGASDIPHHNSTEQKSYYTEVNNNNNMVNLARNRSKGNRIGRNLSDFHKSRAISTYPDSYSGSNEG